MMGVEELSEKDKISLGFLCKICKKVFYEGYDPPGHPVVCEDCKEENRNDLKNI